MSIQVEWRGGAVQDFANLGKAMVEIRALFPHAFYHGWETVERNVETMRIWESQSSERAKEPPVARVLRHRGRKRPRRAGD